MGFLDKTSLPGTRGEIPVQLLCRRRKGYKVAGGRVECGTIG